MRGMHNTAAELQKFHISLCTDQHLPTPLQLTLCPLHAALFQCNRLWLICCYLLSSRETVGGSRQEELAAQAVSNRESEVSAEWGLVWTSAFRQAHKLGSFAAMAKCFGIEVPPFFQPFCFSSWCCCCWLLCLQLHCEAVSPCGHCVWQDLYFASHFHMAPF